MAITLVDYQHINPVVAEPAAIEAVSRRLPDPIIGDGQWIVADMDGTLIGAPGYRVEPTLDESVAKEAIFDWLRAGGSMLVLTGCETKRTMERFAQHFPEDLKEALTARRLLVGTNGGSVLYYYDGTCWREDVNFRKTAIKGRDIVIPEQKAEAIIEQASGVINRFYKELYDNQMYIEERVGKTQAEKYKEILRIARENPNGFTLDQLLTLNSDKVPRIEVRKADNGAVVQIVLIGIPVDLHYDVSELEGEVLQGCEIVKVAVTHEINIEGVDKALAVRWLQEAPSGYPKFEKDKSVALGDRPSHNDAPLTRAVGAFVSVCERDQPDYIPPHVHLRIGQNQVRSAKFIRALLTRAESAAMNNELTAIIPRAIEDAVRDIR